jgi:hypothetical protein
MSTYSNCQLGVLKDSPFNLPITNDINGVPRLSTLNSYCNKDHTLDFNMGQYGNCFDNDKNYYTCVNNSWVKSKDTPTLPLSVVSTTLPNLTSGVYTINLFAGGKDGFLSSKKVTSSSPYISLVPITTSAKSRWIINNSNNIYTIQDENTGYYLINSAGTLSLTYNIDSVGWNIVTRTGVNNNTFYSIESKLDRSYLNIINNVLLLSTQTDQTTSDWVMTFNGTLLSELPIPVPICNEYYRLTNGVCEPIPTTPAPTTPSPTTMASESILPTTMASISPTTMGGVSQDVAPKTNKMIYIIAAIVIMLFVFGLIMFMKKPKIVSAFGKKLFKCR